MGSYRDKRLYDRGESRFIWAKLRDESGRIKPVSTRCTDEKAATLFCDEWERKAADPAYRRASEATLGGAINDFLDEMRRSKASPVTIGIAITKLGHFIRIWGAEWPTLRISNTTVLDFIDRREAEGVVPYTVKKELGHLKRMLAWARFRGTFPHDLATIIPPNYSGQHKPRSRRLSRDEAMRLLANLPSERAAHVAFILATGARWSESEHAMRVDVDTTELVVQLRGSKTALARGTVPITGVTWDLLIFTLEHAPGAKKLFAPWGNVGRDLNAACVRAGLQPCSPNDLRRSFGSWHRQAILDGGGGRESAAEQVAILLRHATDTLAQTTYARISGAELGPSIRAFSPVPILTAGDAEAAPESPNDLDENSVIQHARQDSNLRLPASKAVSHAMPVSARCAGNKLAHARRKLRSDALPVSILTATAGNKAFRASARRWLMRRAA